MKKNITKIMAAIAVMFSSFFINPITHAACAPTFYVGTETVSGCSGATNPEIAGFSIDVENNKITLNNYNGGGIYYLCHANCPTTKEMEIELLGENTINSKQSATFPQENGLPDIIDAGFINIVPTFTGNGTLIIDATIPFTFEDHSTKSFALSIAGQESQILTNSNYNTETLDTTIIENEEMTNPETTTTGANSSQNQSFFDTTAGLITLITVPSVLVIIIFILAITLAHEKGKRNNTNNPPISTSPTNPTI